MPQGKKRPRELERLVRELVSKDESITGKELKTKIEKEHKEYSYSKRTYEKIKSEVSDRVQEIRGGILEQRWHLGMLTQKYEETMTMPIYPQSVPRILKIEEIASYPVTLRRARWISYLSHCIENDKHLKDISFGYAGLELIANFTDEYFDTSQYDSYLSDKSKHEALSQRLWQDISRDDWGAKYDMLLKLTDGVLGTPVEKVLFRGRSAYGVLGDGKKYKWGPAFAVRKFLQVKGLIGESITQKNGDTIVTLTQSFIPNIKQLKKSK